MWIANVSNGAVITEDEIPIVDGGPTPWMQLLARCKAEGFTITGLRLGVGPALTNALPRKHCDGYWQGYESITFMTSGIERLRQGIGSVIGDSVYITWMELGNNGLTYVWQEIRTLKECEIGNTLAL